LGGGWGHRRTTPHAYKRDCYDKGNSGKKSPVGRKKNGLRVTNKGQEGGIANGTGGKTKFEPRVKKRSSRARTGDWQGEKGQKNHKNTGGKKPIKI